MIGLYGMGGAICQRLIPMLPEGETTHDLRNDGIKITLPRYVFAGGYLLGWSFKDQTWSQRARAWSDNYGEVVDACEKILDTNTAARIVIIGSDSGIKGSYDMAYAGAKAALHLYVETKRLAWPGQQLVCIAPGIISDAGMTTRREDIDRLKARAAKHPKGRFCSASEVARLAHFLLYQDGGYITGTTIRMNGGE